MGMESRSKQEGNNDRHTVEELRDGLESLKRLNTTHAVRRVLDTFGPPREISKFNRVLDKREADIAQTLVRDGLEREVGDRTLPGDEVQQSLRSALRFCAARLETTQSPYLRDLGLRVTGIFMELAAEARRRFEANTNTFLAAKHGTDEGKKSIAEKAVRTSWNQFVYVADMVIGPVEAFARSGDDPALLAPVTSEVSRMLELHADFSSKHDRNKLPVLLPSNEILHFNLKYGSESSQDATKAEVLLHYEISGNSQFEDKPLHSVVLHELLTPEPQEKFRNGHARQQEMYRGIIEKTGRSMEDMLATWLANAETDGSKFEEVAVKIRKEIGTGEISSRQKSGFSDAGFSFLKNVSVICALEAQEPGSVEFLLDEYQVEEPGRYPARMLLAQYRERDSQEPYGLILYPHSDWNQSFRVEYRALTELFQDVKNIGLKVRVAEAGSKRDIGRLAVKLQKEYASAGPVQFAVIGGHGAPNTIQFGSYKEGEVNEKMVHLSKEDLEGRGVQRAGALLGKDAPIALVSCSTGAPQGIGQALSKTFDTTVTAPSVPTNVSSMHLSRVGEKLVFDVEYRRPESGKVFERGIRSVKRRVES